MVIDFENTKFEVKRIPRRRSITISLKPNGMGKICASVGCSQRDIESFLNEKRDWIRKVTNRFSQLRDQFPKISIDAGVEIPFMGVNHKIFIQRTKEKTIKLKIVERNFILSLPDSIVDLKDLSVQEKLRHVLRQHYRKVGIELLTRRTEHWSKITGLHPSALSFRGQKTRWGSCSPRGRVTLNWKLVCALPCVIDYVIIHELCHLVHLNHSKNFWKLVETHCPTWKDEKKWLHSRSYQFDFLNVSSDLHRD